MAREFRILLKLGLPVVGGQLGTMLLHVVDTAMVGQFGVRELAAATLATQWIFLTLTMGMGLVMGIDPLVSQSHGAGDSRGAAHALQHGLLLALAASVPISGAWLATEPLLGLLGQDPELSRLAHQYTVLQLPSVFPFLVWAAFRSYLQGREIVAPAMWIMLPVNLLNVLFNWLLIFGPGPFPAWGLEGAGMATCLARVLMAVLLGAWIWFGGLYQDAGESPDWSKRWRWHELRVPFGLGWPSSVQMGLEVLAFAATALLAGRLGQTALAAHSIVLSFIALLFMVPLGAAFGTTTRVGNLIGAGKQESLPSALAAAGVFAVVAVVFNVLVLLVGSESVPHLYTSDSRVLTMAKATFVVAAAFQVFDCVQVVVGGALRGMGRTRAPALGVFIAYYVVGLPLGYHLGITKGGGLTGLWWGLASGLMILAVLVSSWLVFVLRTKRLTPLSPR